MEKKKAIELLKKYLQEVPHLKELDYIGDDSENNRQKLDLWVDKCRNVIKAGLDHNDLRRFASYRPGHVVGFEEQEDYTGKLTDYETALKSIIQKYEILGIEEVSITKAKPKDIPKDTIELPVYIFDKMQFHPKVVEASKSLFETGHYSQAIFEAFKVVNNFVKEKTGLSLDGKDLMAKVFREEDPIIKLNELKTRSDKDEQEGFMFLYMGAMVGIRNPKAHETVIQKDPYRTLEYLAFASLLMRRVEEGGLIKTKPPRKIWDLEKFLMDARERCGEETSGTILKLHDFAKDNAFVLNWGTGAIYGSFTFRQIKHGRMVSIFTVYSDGTVYLSFGSMKNKGVSEDIMESFRKNLNKIPEIGISQDVVTIDNKYPFIWAKILTKQENIRRFEDAVLSLCQQLKNNKEQI